MLRPNNSHDLPPCIKETTKEGSTESSKIDAIYEPGLVTLEINKIERACYAADRPET